MGSPAAWILSFTLCGALIAPAWGGEPKTAADIARKLVCYCGTCSNQTIHDCTCGTAGQARQEIRDRLDRGETPTEIVASFTDRFGEKILIAPTKRGFNLVAWVTPFVALLAGSFGLLLAIRRWSLAPVAMAAETADGLPPDSSEDPKLLERLEREIAEIED